MGAEARVRRASGLSAVLNQRWKGHGQEAAPVYVCEGLERRARGASARNGREFPPGHGDEMKRIVVALLSVAALAMPVVANAAELGKARFRLNADSAFEHKWSVEEGKTEAQINEWIEHHAALVTGYYPSAKQYKQAGKVVPILAYYDPVTNECGAEPTCIPLNKARRAHILTEWLKAREEGASGVWFDDVNWHCTNRNSFTNSKGEHFEQEHCVAGREIEALHEALEDLVLIKELRKEWPSAIIEFNSQWKSDLELWYKGETEKHEKASTTINKYITEAVEESSLLTKEFGADNVGGFETDTAAYENFINFAVELHTNAVWNSKYAKGIELLDDVCPEGCTADVQEWNLATYFLFANGHDYIGGADPGAGEASNYPEWAGYETPSLGLEVSSGLIHQTEGGNWYERRGETLNGKGEREKINYAIAESPKAGGQESLFTQWVSAPLKSTEWGTIEELTPLRLKAKQGAVLYHAGGAAAATGLLYHAGAAAAATRGVSPWWQRWRQLAAGQTAGGLGRARR